MERTSSPVSGTHFPSAAPAASSSVAGTVGAVLHLSQPEAAALIRSEIAVYLDDVAQGTHRPSLINRTTTGVGKTTSAAQAVSACSAVRAQRLRVVLVIRDHEQSADYRSKLVAGGLPAGDVMIYKGRTDADPQLPPARQALTGCYMPDAVRAVGSRNHIPAATICQRCPIGLAMGIKRLRQQIEEGTSPEVPAERTPEERLQRLELRYDAALDGSGMDPAFVGRVVNAGGCFLHRALPVYREANVLIIPQQAYNDSLSDSQDLVGTERPCVVVADENLDFARERYVVTGTRLDEWREAIQPLQQYGGPDYDRAREALRLIDLLRAERGTEARTVEKFRELCHELKRQLGSHNHTAWWESARWANDGSGKLIAPLRAICDLAAALEDRGAVVYDDDGIHVTTLTPLGERLLAGNTILLDATISDSMVAALRASCDPRSAGDPGQLSLEGIAPAPDAKRTGSTGTKGGKREAQARQPTRIDVLDIRVKQHVEICHLAGRSYGRGLKGSDNYTNRLRKTQQHLLAMILAARAAGTLEETAFLGQKCAIDSDEFRTGLRAHGIQQRWIDTNLGWWGKDDRAHNRWAGLNIVVQSLPWRSPAALRQAWAALRAFDPRLPDGPAAACGLELVAADLVQAIGRCRAVYADPSAPRRVVIAARVPMELTELLERHGLQIGETRANPLASERSEWYDLSKPIAAVLRKMAQDGRSATVLGIAREVRTAGHRASTETILRFLDAMVPANKRGAKKLGYCHLPRLYLAKILRWTHDMRQALDVQAEQTARAANVIAQPLQGYVRKLLRAIGSWLGWDPAPDAAGLPPVPLPQAA